MLEVKANSSRLPIGVESFRELREGGYRYVDKTMEIGQLTEDRRHYEMARPRGFGKTLMLSTMECLLQGERELFQGLAVEPHWDWSKKRPVVRLSLGDGDFASEHGLRACIQSQLRAYARPAGIEIRSQTLPYQFLDVLRGLHRQSGKCAAVLVDDFDRPVLDLLGQRDVAERNRQLLISFLSVLKSCQEHIDSALLVGASSPYLENIFGGVNHLTSLTASRGWPTICGFTEQELDAVFAEELAGLDRGRIRERYLGYRWYGDEQVYCPCDILQLLKERRYRAWWFESASPRPMIDLIMETGYQWESLAGASPGWTNLEKFDATDLEMMPLLFQTGYLTLTSPKVVDLENRPVVDLENRGVVGYPNAAVREAMSAALLRTLRGEAWRKRDERQRLRRALEGSGPDGMAELLRYLLAKTRRSKDDDRLRRDIQYRGVMYAHFAALGEQVWIDRPASGYSWDLCLQAGGRLWAVRFETAWAGVPRKSPSGKDSVESRYGRRGVPVHFFRVTCSKETGDVIGFDSERIPALAEDGSGIE